MKIKIVEFKTSECLQAYNPLVIESSVIASLVENDSIIIRSIFYRVCGKHVNLDKNELIIYVKR